MEATLYDCYICKSEKTTGVCESCLSTLPSLSNIKTETSDCGCIEEICSCLDAILSPHKYQELPQFQAEYLEHPTLDSEAIVKITPSTPNDEQILREMFVTWLSKIFSIFSANE